MQRADASADIAVELRGITKRFPGRGGQQRRQHHRHPRPRARHRRRERRRQVDADEDPLRHAAARRGHHRRERPDGQLLPPSDAIDAGVGMVHQHFMLADNLTVLENIVLGSEPRKGVWLDRRRGAAADRGDRRQLRPRRRAGRPGRGARRRRPPAGRDPQGPLPRREDPDPRRADRGAGAAGGRRALRQPARAEGRGPDGHLHLAQARRGAQGGRRDHRDPPGHHGGHRRPRRDQRPGAGRADGRQRAAVTGDPRVHGHRRADAHRHGADAAARRRAPAPRGHRLHHSQGRGPGHRRGRGQRPERAGRDHHGHASR